VPRLNIKKSIEVFFEDGGTGVEGAGDGGTGVEGAGQLI